MDGIALKGSCRSSVGSRMTTIVGLIVVFAAVLGGYAMAGGPFDVLIQPNEIVVIGGAVIGTVIISSPGGGLKRIFGAFKRASSARRQGARSTSTCSSASIRSSRSCGETECSRSSSTWPDPHKSSLFQKFPSVLADHHAIDFLSDSLRQLVDGCSPEDLVLLFDADLETLHEEEHQPIGLIRTAGDALPGLGIVAAVLGIVITMAHLDGGPEEIGHHVAAALVGTFLGILLCYGVIGPIATAIEMIGGAQHRYLICIKDGVLAAARGNTPELAVEFARRSIFTDMRPTGKEMEEAFKSLKSGG